MRLIAEINSERQAFGIQAFLKTKGIASLYDADGQTYRLWVVEEDDFDQAYALYQEWMKNPQKVPDTPAATVHISKPPLRSQRAPWTLNNLIVIMCALIFMINGYEKQKTLFQSGMIAAESEVTPLEKRWLFDYPQYLVNIEQFFKAYPVRTPRELEQMSPEAKACFEKVKNIPTWKGVVDLLVTHNWKQYRQIPDGTLFGKIRQGEVWRLITPVFLHGGLLHLLFNMAWVWMLGKTLEQRLGALRYGLLALIIGIISNIAQYLMSGPEFLGYSGIVVGMVGFIWMRQKIAPWEGYPLDRGIVRFMAIYVLGLAGIGIVSLALDYFHITEMYINIANTAHLTGGLVGMVCGRLPFFQRMSR